MVYKGHLYKRHSWIPRQTKGHIDAGTTCSQSAKGHCSVKNPNFSIALFQFSVKSVDVTIQTCSDCF